MTGATLPPPYRLVAYDSIGSTNDEAKRLAREGAAEGLVVSARRQSAGRGRRGRSWVSPEGNLYASLVLRPRAAAAATAQLGFVAALGIADAVAELAPGIALGCKWPNDVLANGKKLSGILLEAEMAAGEQPDFVVLGIGINLVSSPRETSYPATSLAEEGINAVAPEAMLAAFVAHFAGWLARWRDAGFAPVREAWRQRAVGLGKTIEVRLAHDTIAGRFVDLDGEGALVLGLAEGDRRIAAGDIFPVAA